MTKTSYEKQNNDQDTKILNLAFFSFALVFNTNSLWICYSRIG